MRALLFGILVFRNCNGQSGDGSSSGIRNVTTNFDIVTETKITYDPLLLDKTSNTYQTNRDRVIDETQPGLEAAAARVSATLISIDVLFSTDSSSFSARRRRQASQTVYTQITPTLNIIETNPDVPQFELSSVQEVEQEMTAVVASASTGSVFVRNATVQTGTPTSSSVEVPADFPIYGDQTSDGDFPIATTTTPPATTTRAETTATTVATPSGTQPQDFPIYEDDSIEIIEDNSDNSGLFPVVTDPATTTPVPTTTTKTTTTKTTTVNLGTPPTGFPIYDDDEIPITVDVDGLFPVVTDDNSAPPNTTTTEQTTTTKSTTTTTLKLPDDFPIYEDQGQNGDFPINDDNTTTTAEQTTTSTSTATIESETTAEPTTVSDSTQSVSLGTTAEPETTKTAEPETTTEETWNSGSQTILSIFLLLASLTIF